MRRLFIRHSGVVSRRRSGVIFGEGVSFFFLGAAGVICRWGALFWCYYNWFQTSFQAFKIRRWGVVSGVLKTPCCSASHTDEKNAIFRCLLLAPRCSAFHIDEKKSHFFRCWLHAPRCSPSHTGEKKTSFLGADCRLLATPFSTSLTIGENDPVLASFDSHRRLIWRCCRGRFAMGATSAVVAMLVLALMSFGDERTSFLRSAA